MKKAASVISQKTVLHMNSAVKISYPNFYNLHLLFLGLPNGLFPRDFPTKILNIFPHPMYIDLYLSVPTRRLLSITNFVVLEYQKCVN